jgi:hypothetical protein
MFAKLTKLQSMKEIAMNRLVLRMKDGLGIAD